VCHNKGSRLTETLCIEGQRISLGETASHGVRGKRQDSKGSWVTENTIRKNGLKWSNISVKKYHQSPGLGVRSGSWNLSIIEVKPIARKQKAEACYPAPQVFRTHPQPPATRADANSKATKYKANSANKGMHLRSLCGNNLGEAKCDWGSERRSRRTGGSRSIAGRDRCDSIASTRREGDGWPRQHQNLGSSVKKSRAYPAQQT